MSDGRHCKHGLHVAEGCAICFGSDSKTWRGTYIDLAHILARDNEPDWMRAGSVVILPAADHDALREKAESLCSCGQAHYCQSEYDTLRTENETLRAELAEAQKQRDDLSRAYINILGPIKPA